jgi:hypothetical protein
MKNSTNPVFNKPVSLENTAFFFGMKYKATVFEIKRRI